MINPDPWSEWKAGKTDGESNEWTDYQQENPVKVADLSESAVDPLEAIAGGALATLIGKGLGTAISAMFADGGMVRKPKTEQEARTNRQRRNRLAQARGDLRLATGGAAGGQDNEQAGNEAIAELALAWKFGQYLRPDLARDPEVVSALAQQVTPEDAIQIIDEFLAFLQSGSENTMSVLASLSVAKGEAGALAYSSDQQQPNGITREATVNPEDGGVQLAGGGFLGGNMGIALGSGVDEYDKQRKLKSDEAWNDVRMKLAKPELDTLDEATAARRSSLQLQGAENQANASMIGDKMSNARLKLMNDNATQEDQAYGRLSQHLRDRDYEGATRYANSLNLPQFGGSKVSSFAHDPATGATATLDDGRTVGIPQTSLDRGTKALNGKYDFMTNRVTGDIIRVNDRTGEAEPVIRADGTVNRPLSLAQQTSNKQIEISRRKIAGMSPEEIRRRTTKTSDTDRNNPDYDPMLAQHARLANRRMYGSDPWYDQQGQPQQPPAQPQQNPYAAKFNADPKMRGNTLGAKTSRGYQVLDASGKVVGYYD